MSAPCVMGQVANRCPLRNHAAARVQTVFRGRQRIQEVRALDEEQ
jgi:hypothetical protein